MSAINPSPQTDIRDLKDLVLVPQPPWLLYLGIGVLLVLFLSVALWYFLRWRRAKLRVEKPFSPQQAAELRLAELAGSAWLDQGKAKEFHGELSAILRLYIEQQCGFPASDRTWEELKREIGEIPGISVDLGDEFLSILAATDLVKFANAEVSRERSLELVARAQQFVIRTIPQPQLEEQH